jgi:hypothetical protein
MTDEVLETSWEPLTGHSPPMALSASIVGMTARLLDPTPSP